MEIRHSNRPSEQPTLKQKVAKYIPLILVDLASFRLGLGTQNGKKTKIDVQPRGVSRNPGRGVLTRMLSMNGVWSCMQLVGRSSRRLGSAQLYRAYCMINFSSAGASELHLFFDSTSIILYY